MTILTSIAVAMVAGLLMTRVLNVFHLPDVTAYLIAGILIGPVCLGRLGIAGLGFPGFGDVSRMDLLCNLALGFIAFAIGTEFMLPKLKSIGKQATIIAVFQAVLAAVLVAAALAALHVVMPDRLSLPAAITLGAVASATAPAATLMVVRQYKAEGPVTNMLLPVVALDDAVGLVLFAVALGVAKALQGGALSFVSIAVNPLLEILGSLVLGSALGWLLDFSERFFHSNRNRLILMTAAVTLATALSMLHFELGAVHIGFSSLLTNMMMGTVFCNCCPIAEDLMEREDKWTAPLYCLFFVLSGAALRPDVFADSAMVGVGAVYILARSCGKYFGAGWSAAVQHCEPAVVRYLGVTLLPQAGVALGMSLAASEQLGADGAVIRSITLFSVLVYELIGPTLTKLALTAAGEIVPGARDARTGRVRRIPGSGQRRRGSTWPARLHAGARKK
ncbi:MAG: cation:proton antiporter [Oscillospiraceae bacterium]|nr:cation:proton antiporter [Oscillospiraceae bacterium]